MTTSDDPRHKKNKKKTGIYDLAEQDKGTFWMGSNDPYTQKMKIPCCTITVI